MDKSSADLSNDIASKEQELQKALDHQFTIEQEILLLQRQALDIQSKRKDLEITNSKARHLVKKLNIELSLLQKHFWKSKNAGL